MLVLFCCALVVGQSVSPAPETRPQDQGTSEQKTHSQDFGLEIGAHGKQLGALDILSDTRGVDFHPYLKRILQNVRQNWYHLIPPCAEMMKGKLAIEFAITKEGEVADMRLVARSAATTLDRAAWASITASNPFPPLPNEFTGSYLALRVRFYYNPDSTGPDSSGKDCPADPIKIDLAESRTKTKSGIAVSISAPRPSDLEVPLGGSIVLTAIVTGTGTKENTVDWNLSGFGCSGAMCGEITNDSYHAPTVMPNPPFVTLTAISKADTAAKASVTLHIVQPPN